MRDARPFWARVAAVRPLVLALVATGLVFLTVRSAVLDNVVGSFTAEGLQGLSAGQRALTMLGVVPEWARLFIWPAHLQADYSPQEINGAIALGHRRRRWDSSFSPPQSSVRSPRGGPPRW